MSAPPKSSAVLASHPFSSRDFSFSQECANDGKSDLQAGLGHIGHNSNITFLGDNQPELQHLAHFWYKKNEKELSN